MQRGMDTVREIIYDGFCNLSHRERNLDMINFYGREAKILIKGKNFLYSENRLS